jgi:CheY-like chemotaxis protein
LNRAAEAMQQGLGDNDTAKAMALAILLYFPVCGFLFTYLWTRLFLARELRRSDLITLTKEELERQVHAAEQKTIEAVTQSTPPSTNAPAAATAPRDLQPTQPKRRALWVDDMPANNASLKTAFEQHFGLEFDLSLSTEEALSKIEPGKYSVIISDMGRPGDHRAAITLLRQLRAGGIDTPYIIYAARGGEPANQAEAQREGAFGMTNSPQELIQLIKGALERS